MFNLGIGLLILMASNITLGSTDALLNKNFDKAVFVKGVLKSAIIAVCMAGVYLAGYMNPDMVNFDFDGVNVNLMTAIKLIVSSGFIWYGKECIVKISNFVIPSKKKV